MKARAWKVETFASRMVTGRRWDEPVREPVQTQLRYREIPFEWTNQTFIKLKKRLSDADVLRREPREHHWTFYRRIDKNKTAIACECASVKK
jgi:hypothetical protein